MKRWLAVLLCLVLCLGTTVSFAAPDRVWLFVSPDGNDRYPGSESLPFATLEKAIKTVRLLEEKAVIVLREGTYEGGISLEKEPLCLTLRSYPGEEVVIRATEEQSALTLKQCTDVSVQGIVFEGGTGAVVSQCENAQIFDCTFSHMKQGIVTEGTVRLEGNLFLGIEGTAVTAKAGDRKILTSGDCFIGNNSFFRYAQSDFNAPAVILDGVGIILANNHFSNSQGPAVLISGNNHLVQYNKIEEITSEFAIVTEGNVTSRGSKIHHNYIAKGPDIGVLLNDFSSQITVTDNLFSDLSVGLEMRGGRDNLIRGNLSMNCEKSLVLNSLPVTGSVKRKLQGQLEKAPYKEEIWSSTYPALLSFLKDNPEVAKNNTVFNNAVYQSAVTETTEKIRSNGRIEKDTVETDAALFEELVSYEQIDCTKIGKASADDDIRNSIILQLSSPRAMKHGRMAYVDEQNHLVMPFSEQDRTLIPVRFVAESMGADVLWDAETEEVTVKLGERTVRMKIGSKKITVNGEEKELDVAAVVKNDRTLIPLRAVAENLGFEVHWHDSGMIVIGKEPIDMENEWILSRFLRLLMVD